MVEFAALLPVLLLILLGIFEFARAYYYSSAIINAAWEGARYGVTNPNDTQGIRDAAINLAWALNLTNDNIVITCPDGNCTTVDNRLTVTVGYSFEAVVPLVPSFPMTGVATMRIQSVP
ncbi:MAG: pilus assembly protein [Chloroflexi bacterium]|nr:pilus assembly protein [Chloroflexota bacterium]